MYILHVPYHYESHYTKTFVADCIFFIKMVGRIPNVDSKILDSIILLHKNDIITSDGRGK